MVWISNFLSVDDPRWIPSIFGEMVNQNVYFSVVGLEFKLEVIGIGLILYFCSVLCILEIFKRNLSI